MGGFKRFCIGRSREQRPIDAFVRRAPGAPTVLIIGGVHGNEPKGVDLAKRLLDFLAQESDQCRESTWIILPLANPDGYSRRTRRNARRVDINRNFPTANWCLLPKRSRMYGGPKPASEPETRALVALVDRWQPKRIVTIHSIGDGRHCNNYDGPARRLAQRMSQFNKYPVMSSIGYPTPGSFGTWAGRERKIPTVTLELPSRKSGKLCWTENREALLLAGLA